MKSDITLARTIPNEPPAVEQGSTMASTLAETIRTDIIRGRLAPGMRLKVQELARLYDSGTIPVREALSRLTTSGFVYARDRRGFFVKEVSRAELLDLTRVRLMIEPAALRDSIEHGDIAWEERVLSAHHRMSKLRIHADAQAHELNLEWEAAHDNFHKQLISACTSAWLLQFADTLRDQTTRYRHISVASQHTHTRDVAAEHAAILEACLARKLDLAAGLICDHTNTTTSLALSETQPIQQ